MISADLPSRVLAELTTLTRLQVAPFRSAHFGIRAQLASSHEEHDRIATASRKLHAPIISVHKISQEYLNRLQHS